MVVFFLFFRYFFRSFVKFGVIDNEPSFAVLSNGFFDVFFVLNTGRNEDFGWIFWDKTDGVMVKNDIFGVAPEQAIFALRVFDLDEIFGDLEAALAFDTMILINGS